MTERQRLEATSGGDDTRHDVRDTTRDGTRDGTRDDSRDDMRSGRAAADFERDALPWLPDVARFARSLTHDEVDAGDLTQETFLRAYQAWHTFIPGTDCRRWLFTICRNAFLRTRQREQRFVSVGGDEETDTLAVVYMHKEARESGLDDLFTRLDVGPAIARAMDTLPEVFRSAAQLVDVEGLSYEEAAEVLGVPVGTVRSRLFRARRLLQQELLAYAQDAGLAHRDLASAPARGTPARATSKQTRNE